MSLNTAHANNGVLIYAGECILLYCDNVVMEFSGQDRPEFKGDKAGRLYLTTHRMIFNSSNTKDPLLSFSFPFCTMKDVELEQPMFGANYIKGKVRAQPNGGWVGEVKFKLHFKHGGAIEYGQAMLQAAGITKRNHQFSDEPPAYQPPSGPWHDAPPQNYAPPNGGYYGWVPPPSNAFPNAPPANSVYMTDMPPPYPGLYPGNAGNGYTPSSNDAKAAEAAASGTAYYDPNTHYAYVPPAYSNEAPPPSYEESKDKKFK
uniref:GRAM domain-containing protein n=1 Tax=Daphnia galeata TaxID=27404 RepID=A0A8J2S024_9CRUS|nr:unnamed protein product [Daphnia galeata]